MAARTAVMAFGNQHAAVAIDGAAAALFAGAVAFAASAMGSGALAGLLAPLAFVLAYAGLACVDGEQLHALPSFEPVAIDPPQPDADEIAYDGNVVRLFDRRQLAIACPTPAGTGGATDDAALALSAALAELKRDLR